MTIYINRQVAYNIAILEVEVSILRLPREEASMAVSKAQQRAVNKYVKEKYDRVNVTMPKGQKEAIQAHAEQRGESVNGFIGRAIQETMERDKAVMEHSGGSQEGQGKV